MSRRDFPWELPPAEGCDKIVEMRMRMNVTRSFRPVAAVLFAGLLLLCGIAEASSRFSDAASPDAISSQKKRKNTKSQPKAQTKAAPPQKADGPLPRPALTAAEQGVAHIPNMPEARFWGDSEAAYLKAIPGMPGPWLILSAGGEDGAYGAGLLAGWSKSGERPQFSLVTGVSTGALIAPFAFLGPQYDEALRDAYTKVSSVDIFEVGGKGESLLDTWPLHDLIAKRVTPDLLKAIAAEHARGRRLMIVTTNLDAGRPVVWDIGAIASRGDDQALKLVRDVMVAAVSIPGAFPPVLIDVVADGRRTQEMHADGGITGQFYLAPESMLATNSAAKLPATDIYLIANMKLRQDFELTERSLTGILSRTVTTAIKYMLRNNIDHAYLVANRSGAGFHFAYVPQDFSARARGPFDPDYMRPLFEAGQVRGASPTPFFREPPDHSQQLNKAAR